MEVKIEFLDKIQLLFLFNRRFTAAIMLRL